MTPTPDPDKATSPPAVEAEDGPRTLAARLMIFAAGNPLSRFNEHLRAANAADLRQAADLLTSLVADKARLEKYAALGEACERNGLAEFTATGEMLFQPPADWIAERAAARAEADLSSLKQRVAEVLEPFANLKGRFPETVLVEICYPCPDNPSPRIEPFLVRHIERAAELHASLTQERK